MLDESALQVLFLSARTHRRWQEKPVPREVLVRLYELLRLAPTSGNCNPGRFVFVATPAGKERLRPCLSEGNVQQTMSAPVTAIVAHDLRFYEHMPRLSHMANAQARFAADPDLARTTAFRNGSLQGAYLILAARALGLDCGPMSGFDNDRLDAGFFPDGRYRSNFLCNLGYGTGEGIRPRAARLGFDEACSVV
ncbi:MAG: malonic semialdehyde reductase [Proteobacteria bacterium]|nr:malonic semialdehyde reductase [Pseudomonadota bacterium]